MFYLLIMGIIMSSNALAMEKNVKLRTSRVVRRQSEEDMKRIEEFLRQQPSQVPRLVRRPTPLVIHLPAENDSANLQTVNMRAQVEAQDIDANRSCWDRLIARCYGDRKIQNPRLYRQFSYMPGRGQDSPTELDNPRFSPVSPATSVYMTDPQ
jgi:hypothetical protein